MLIQNRWHLITFQHCWPTNIATVYLVEQYVYHFLYVWIVHSTCQRTLFNNSQYKSSARSNVYFIRSTSSLSIKRFWGKGERWKRKKERAEGQKPSFLFSPSPISNLLSPSHLGRPDTQAIQQVAAWKSLNNLPAGEKHRHGERHWQCIIRFVQVISSYVVR